MSSHRHRPPRSSGSRRAVAAAVGFFALLIVGPRALATAPTVIASYAQLVEAIDRGEIRSLEEFLERLSPSIKDNLTLVYESKSPIQSSLESPRIILRDPAASVIFAFSSNPAYKNGNRLEVIEVDPDEMQLRFRKVEFAPGGKPRYEHAPASCVNCHGFRDRNGEVTRMRPIWDTYPDWIGFYGTSHNDLWMGRGDRLGASHFRDLEFEVRALEELKKSAAAKPRLALLPRLQSLDRSALGELNTALTDILYRLNVLSVAGQARNRLRALKGDPETMRIAQGLLEAMNGGKKVADVVPAAELEDLTGRIQAGKRAYYDRKLDFLRELVRKHGTPGDLARFFPDGSPIQTSLYMNPGYVDADGIVAFIHFLEKIGIDARDFGPTRQLDTFAFVGPVSAEPMVRIFRETVEDYLDGCELTGAACRNRCLRILRENEAYSKAEDARIRR